MKHPTCFSVLAWDHAEEIAARESAFRPRVDDSSRRI